MAESFTRRLLRTVCGACAQALPSLREARKARSLRAKSRTKSRATDRSGAVRARTCTRIEESVSVQIRKRRWRISRSRPARGSIATRMTLRAAGAWAIAISNGRSSSRIDVVRDRAVAGDAMAAPGEIPRGRRRRAAPSRRHRAPIAVERVGTRSSTASLASANPKSTSRNASTIEIRSVGSEPIETRVSRSWRFVDAIDMELSQSIGGHHRPDSGVDLESSPIRVAVGRVDPRASRRASPSDGPTRRASAAYP